MKCWHHSSETGMAVKGLASLKELLAGYMLLALCWMSEKVLHLKVDIQKTMHMQEVSKIFFFLGNKKKRKENIRACFFSHKLMP